MARASKALTFQSKPLPQQTAEKRPDRVGKRLLQAHIPELLSTELRVLAARNKTTVTALMEESITDLFTKHGHKINS
jgi:hypothetical protein